MGVCRAELHDTVPADLLHKVADIPLVSCNSAQTPRLGVNSCRARVFGATHLLGMVTVLILSAVVASWHYPIGAALAEGRSGMLSCNPAHGYQLFLLFQFIAWSRSQYL